MKVFLDANILFTAAITPDGKSAYLMRNAPSLDLPLLTSSLAVEEARRNLEARYPQSMSEFLRVMRHVEITKTLPPAVCPIALPPKDIPIYLTALEHGATHLLTGDHKHFGSYMEKPHLTGGLVIQTVSSFLENV